MKKIEILLDRHAGNESLCFYIQVHVTYNLVVS